MSTPHSSRISRKSSIAISLNEEIQRILCSKFSPLKMDKNIEENQNQQFEQGQSVLSASETIQNILLQKCSQVMKLHQALQQEARQISQILTENETLSSDNAKMKEQIRQLRNQLMQQCLQKNQTQSPSQPCQQTRQSKSTASKYTSSNVFNLNIAAEPLIKKSSIEIQTFQVNNQQLSFQKLIQQQQLSTQTDLEAEDIDQIETMRVQISKLNKYNTNLSTNIDKLEVELYKQKTARKQYQANQISTQFPEQSVISQKVDQNNRKEERTRQTPISINLIDLTSPEKRIQKLLQQPWKLNQNLIEKRYVGKMLNGKKTGNGICQYRNGFSFKGLFRNDLRNGLGSLSLGKSLVYSGNWKAGLFEGAGTLFYSSQDQVQKIEGYFQKGKLHGYATITKVSGTRISRFYQDSQVIMTACLQNNDTINYSEPSQIYSSY